MLGVTGCLTPSNFETTTPPVSVLTSTFTPALALTPFPAAEGPLQAESPSAPGTATATLAGAASQVPATTTSTLLPAATVAAGEQRTIDLINAQRAAAGVPPLARDETLMGIARARVADMVARGYMGHTDPVTGEYLLRPLMRAAGYNSAWYGENWYGTSIAPPAIAGKAMTWLMADPPHAQNILSAHYDAVGVGIAFNGQLWLLVQDFAGK